MNADDHSNRIVDSEHTNMRILGSKYIARNALIPRARKVY